jgi:hypothetical protein
MLLSKKNLSIEHTLSEIIYEYNNKKIHSSTGLTPSDAFSLTEQDKNKINDILEKRKKTIKRVKPGVIEDDKVLISINFKKDENRLKYLKPSKRGALMFRLIPGIVKGINERNEIKITIMRDFNKFSLEKDEEYYVDIRLLQKISDETFEKFVKQMIMN